jgi:hypothetical protein
VLGRLALAGVVPRHDALLETEEWLNLHFNSDTSSFFLFSFQSTNFGLSCASPMPLVQPLVCSSMLLFPETDRSTAVSLPAGRSCAVCRVQDDAALTPPHVGRREPISAHISTAA